MNQPEPVKFKPELHMAFDVSTVQRVTLSEIGLDPSSALTDFACTYPFRLLSAEGVRQVRAELTKKEVQQNCRFANKRNPYALRGMWKYSSFLTDLWKSREMNDAISQAAGYPLVLNPLDWEIGHVNAQVDKTYPSEFNPPYAITQNLEEKISSEHINSPAAEFDANFTTTDYNDTFVAEKHEGYDDEKNFVDFWHVDDYPFVCVVMLSDPTNFEGGETVVRNNQGGIIKLQFPEAGYATILQGRYVIHCARRAYNVTERITMVPSYLPADVMAPDTSVLDAAKGNSNLNELFQQWSTYRFERFTQQVDKYTQKIKSSISKGNFDEKDVIEMCNNLAAYLHHTKKQLTFSD